MGSQRTSFGKLQRDRAKKAKAAAKRERRQERGTAEEATEGDTLTADLTVGEEAEGELSAGELLTLIEAIHKAFEAKTISYEEFEEKKVELLARLPVD